MKRSIFSSLGHTGFPVFCLVWTLSAGACSSPKTALGDDAPETSGWVTPPLIDRADRTPQGLILRGTSSPSGRVVVRGEGEVGYATGADQTGRFVLRIAPPSTDTIFVVENQSGQDAFPSPDRLLVGQGPQGVVAMLTPGGPSRRLDGAGPLGAIDTDGRTTLASGQTRSGGAVAVSLDGDPATSVKAAQDGRWAISVPAGTTAISVGGRRYVLPALGIAETQGNGTRPLSGGLNVTWSVSAGAAQTTWFPGPS